jgi:hypothetical protein
MVGEKLMSYGPKKYAARRAAAARRIVTAALLAGMEVEKHRTVSRYWKGEAHNVYSTTIDGVQIYRLSKASLARVYLEAKFRGAKSTRAAGPRVALR